MQEGSFLFTENVAGYIKHKIQERVLTCQTQLKFVFMTITCKTQ